jgi:hypothetical protein
VSTAQVQRVVSFGKGLWSGTSRFQQPQGSVPRGSNLIWLRRGAMRTTDGTLLLSSLNGNGVAIGQNPFRWIGRYAPSTPAIPSILTLQIGGGSIKLIDVTSASYSTPLATYASSYTTPSFVQAKDDIAIALGYDIVPQLWNGTSSAVITQSWFGTKLASWTASTAITQGTPIAPTTPNGHVYVAQNAGMTAGGQPSWPTGTGSQIQDGSVVWLESGPSSPPVPPGAAFIFYHGDFLFLWGTSATYQADGINGPDTLAQSDSLNFNSWNPLNSTFVGKGDGTLPQGGGVLTLSEAGIAATSQLVLFKDTDTYVFLGYFPNWRLNKTPNGVGCVAPGTIQFIADVGLVRLSYRGIAVFDGQDDFVDEYTNPIREYLFGADEAGIIPVDWLNINLAMAAQLDNPRMYLLAVPLVGSGGSLTRILAYDIALKAWTTPIDLPSGIASLAYIQKNPLVARTLFGGFDDGTIQAFGNNCSSTWANGTLISWGVRTPEIGAPDTPSYIRRLNVRGQRVYNSQPRLTNAVLNYQDREGVVRIKTLIAPPSTEVLTASLDVDETVLSANIDLTGVDRAILEGLGYQYTPKPPSEIGGGVATTQLQQVVTPVYQQGGSATVGANLQTVTVTLPATAPSANYFTSIAPNWNTTFWVTGKSIVQFVVYFNTPAPADGTGSIDWMAEIFQ